MKKSTLIKLGAILLCVLMSLSFFACEGGTADTLPPSIEETEPDIDTSDEEPSDDGESESRDAESDDTESSGENESETDEHESDSADNGTDTEQPTEAADEIAENIDYYLVSDQETLGKKLYLTGKLDGYYPASSKYKSDAVKVRLEACEGGFNLFFIKNAVKVYINAEVNGKLNTITFGSPAKTVYTYDEDNATLTTKIGDKTYFIGMYGDFKIFSLSELTYIRSSFAAGLENAGCEHSYLADAEGHYSLACGICGAEKSEKSAHDQTLISVREGGMLHHICESCGYIVSSEGCDGDHYVGDATHHWEAACEICDTPEGAKQEHGALRADGVDSGVYEFMCSVCSYSFYRRVVGEGVTEMFTPLDWSVGATTYFQVGDRDVCFEASGAPYGSASGSAASSTHAAQILYSRATADTKMTVEAEQNKTDVGNAKYLVFKIRTTNKDQRLKLSFSTTGYDGEKGYYVPISQNDTWEIIVIDLSATFGDYYAKDSKKGTYIVDTFYFTIQPMAVETKIDIAYMAFADGSWGELDALIEEQTALYVSGTASLKVNVKDGTCADGHAYELKAVDGKYVGICPICKAEKDYGVNVDSANKFLPADILSTPSGIQGKCDITITKEGNDEFVRINNFSTNGKSWGGINFFSESAPEVSGRYMVMKYRIGDNGLGQTQLKFYTSTQRTGLADETQGVTIKVSEDGMWHTVVIDLAERVKSNAGVSDFVAAADGSYSVKFLQMRTFHGKQAQNADGAYVDIPAPDDYMDISYIAFTDDLSDLSGIIDSDTYEWSVSSGENEIRKIS